MRQALETMRNKIKENVLPESKKKTELKVKRSK